ncbi:MAG: hypothetical protein ACK5KL_13095 [Dysgonomonas sp.]
MEDKIKMLLNENSNCFEAISKVYDDVLSGKIDIEKIKYFMSPYCKKIQDNLKELKSLYKDDKLRIYCLNGAIRKYFDNHPDIELVRAKELMPSFVKNHIFNKDDPARPGKSLRAFLRKLDKKGRLNEIPYVFADRKKRNINWYFKRIG